jgi:SAM-dependent methyltransferase
VYLDLAQSACLPDKVDQIYMDKSIMTTTGANSNVLAFYKELPFNYQETAILHADRIKSTNAVDNYPVLKNLLKSRGIRVFEIGCGSGWLSNAMSYHHGADVMAIDFNPVVIKRAREVAKLVGSTVNFEVADLFQYVPERPPVLSVSLGVLHHTNDCLGAVKRIFETYTAPRGYSFIGLYHTYGRRPFLDHFADLKAKGYSEEAMLKRYQELDNRHTDDTNLRSWFRDQVLHPHETQHTLAEILPIIEGCGMELISTSINRFQPITSIDTLLEQEVALEKTGTEWLAKNMYFPGFFIFLVQNTAR